MSNTIKELWDSFKSQIADRLANPFTGAFAVAWCIFNFRLLVVLIWIEPYRQKFAYIDSALYPTLTHWFIRAIIAPVLAAYAYLLFYPKATMWAATRYRRMQTQANNEMRAAQGEALMTRDEFREARNRLTLIESKLHADSAEAADRTSRQSDLIQKQRTQIEELKKQLEQQKESTERKSLATLGTASKPQTDLTLGDVLRSHPPVSSNKSVFSVVDANADNPIRTTSTLARRGISEKPPLPSFDEVAESKTKIDLLKALAHLDFGVAIEQLVSLVERTHTVVLHHLEVLTELGLVEKFMTETSDEEWRLTKQGRAFVVKNALVEP